MIRYSGRNTMHSRNVPAAHPGAFIPRFFASVKTQYAIAPAIRNPIRYEPLPPLPIVPSLNADY
jgi:hypothetical protein